MVDYFEPMIEGLEEIEQKRRVTAMKTILSKVELEKENIGYQEPEPKDDTPRRQYEPRATRGRGGRNNNPERRYNDNGPTKGDDNRDT